MKRLRSPYQIFTDNYEDLTSEDKEILGLFNNIFRTVDTLRNDHRIMNRDLVTIFDDYIHTLGGELRASRSRDEKIKAVA